MSTLHINIVIKIGHFFKIRFLKINFPGNAGVLQLATNLIEQNIMLEYILLIKAYTAIVCSSIIYFKDYKRVF